MHQHLIELLIHVLYINLHCFALPTHIFTDLVLFFTAHYLYGSHLNFVLCRSRTKNDVSWSCRACLGYWKWWANWWVLVLVQTQECG